jgi:hypothetical protein
MRALAFVALLAVVASLAVVGCGTVAPENNPNAVSSGKPESEGATVPVRTNPADSDTPRATPGQQPTNDPAKP